MKSKSTPYIDELITTLSRRRYIGARAIKCLNKYFYGISDKTQIALDEAIETMIQKRTQEATRMMINSLTINNSNINIH